MSQRCWDREVSLGMHPGWVDPADEPRRSARRPTIYEALRDKLGREPSHDEVTADVRRIIHEVNHGAR